MKVMLATLCLNEMQWLPSLYEQHKDWPDLVNWTFVESADIEYHKVNPDRVSCGGTSVDGTDKFLRGLKEHDKRVTYIPYGFCSSDNPAQGKCEARDMYLRIADEVKPDIIVVLDADEFYHRNHQKAINDIFESLRRSTFQAFLYQQRHIWHPPSVQHLPLTFKNEVVGGYWNVPHCRVWRWTPGLTYKENHNWPQLVEGRFLTRWMLRADTAIPSMLRVRQRNLTIPYCVHLGFASSTVSRTAKHRYYASRGEDTSRKMYVDCRQAYETWQEGDKLPHKAKVIPYTGMIPETFNEYLSRPNQLYPTSSDAEGDTSLERAINRGHGDSG